MHFWTSILSRECSREVTFAFAQWRSLQHGGGRVALPWLAGYTRNTGPE